MRHEILLPDLGQTTTEAKIVQWLKSPGDRIERGEPIVVVETDKVDMEVEAFESGYVRELLVKPGELATALTCIAVLTDTADEPYGTAGPSPVPASKPMASPAARILAKELGINLASVRGTGPKELITRKDVRRFAEERPAGDDRHRALSAMAAMTAQSKREIPHFYMVRDLVMQSAVDWRRRWNDAQPTVRASVNDVFLRAVEFALADAPRLNMAYSNGAYDQRSRNDILQVVARESALSLVPVPDLRGLPWPAFLSHLRQATDPAVSDKSRPAFAISNLGMHGVKEFSAIIPPGCTAVLAVGAVREAAVVVDGKIRVETICTVTLSADHRVVDGVHAAQFLDRLQFQLNSL
jgi:pyruvate dehydrogenase E2 component (dihydrolipoamide acetyltransferase)